MVCVYCKSETHVVNSRLQKRSNQVWRRRQCLKCASIFTTHEAADLGGLLVVSKTGSSEPFSEDLLFTELLLALAHRKDSYSAAREVTATIVQRLLKLPESPVFKPSQISLVVAGVLKRLDQRAWLRYVAEHPSLHRL